MIYWTGEDSAFPFYHKCLYFTTQPQSKLEISVLRISYKLQLEVWKYQHVGIFQIKIFQELQDKDTSKFHLCTSQYRSGSTKMQTAAQKLDKYSGNFSY